MKSFLYKYIHLLFGIAILVAIGIYGYVHTEYAESASVIPISFTIESDENTMDISLYQADDTHYYVFLPSYAKLEQVKINMPLQSDITVNNLALSRGMYCNDFDIGEQYDFKVNDRHDMTLEFYQSANMPTLYINTGTGSMARIHNDKNYEEPSSMILLSPDGNITAIDTNCYLQGRGNATWGKDKKPYSLTLSSSISLLEMTPSTDWILLANSFDETNLRNKIVYDLAAQTKLKWTPACEYVDVYLNGSYNGLYLLTERIEADSEHLDINTFAGSFLCKVDHSDRWDSMRHPFKSSLGRNVEITGPKEVTSIDENRIQTLVNGMESSLLSAPDSGELSNIDLDSWACKYLIDEISANGDSDLASSYFYYEDGIFYAGPVWDYDNSFGNNITSKNPASFVAKLYNKAPYYCSPYYSSLYANVDFYNRVVQLYETDFLPLLNDLMNTGIPTLSAQIATASQMNSIRWQDMFAKSNFTITTTEDLIYYLESRVSFLSSAWLDNVEYCTVQFQTIPNGRYNNYAVIKGSYFDTSILDTDISTWYHADTGELFDSTQPITQDISLIQQYEQ